MIQHSFNHRAVGRRPLHRSAAAMEVVEPRRLCSYTVTMNGTDKKDDFTVAVATAGPNNGKLCFYNNLNGNTIAVYPVADVSGIVFNMGYGDDRASGVANVLCPITLYGGDGNDILQGGGGNDFVYGSVGNDSIVGGNGNDRLDAGDGNNTLIGSVGDDMLIAGSGTDSIDGNQGVDTLDYTNHTVNVTITLDTVANDGAAGEKDYVMNTVENIIAGSGNDTLVGSTSANVFDGGAGDDNISGGSGNDSLIGGSGNDILHGNDGADTLSGGLGNDALYGDNDNDVLDALDNVQGNDTIDGGLGTDTATYDALDVVTNL